VRYPLLAVLVLFCAVLGADLCNSHGTVGQLVAYCLAAVVSLQGAYALTAFLQRF